jgi:3-carboxy-cis,cis-muconate cycloisomerase
MTAAAREAWERVYPVLSAGQAGLLGAILARAEAHVAVIPFEPAQQIAKLSAADIDLAALAKGALRSGFPIIALVQELKRLVGPAAAPYVHWGATTQDIMDTACVLQIRNVVNTLRERFDRLEGL